ncbi:MAG: GAF domain-containing protein [Aggregatilineales bacterium]
MKPTTKIYLEFIETLAKTAERNQSRILRHRLRIEILRYTTSLLNASSIYLCQHDFEQKQSIVRAAYLQNTTNPTEYMDVEGEIYEEDGRTDWINWLYHQHHTVRILHVEDMTEDDPEYQDYIEFDAISVMFAGVYHQNDLWGYVEVWNSRQHHDYTPEEQNALQHACLYIGRTLITPDG